MAQCFMLLGGANAAEELLLYLLSMKQQTTTRGAASVLTSLDVMPRYPATLMLTSNGVTMRYSQCDSTTTAAAAVAVGRNLVQRSKEDEQRRSLLWRIFQASTHAEDWATCIASAEELCSLDLNNAKRGIRKRGTLNLKRSDDDEATLSSDAAQCALIFALLQGHNPTQALVECQQWLLSSSSPLQRKDDCCVETQKAYTAPVEESVWTQLLTIAIGLYEADGALLTERGFYDDDDDCNDVGVVRLKSTGTSCIPSLGVRQIRERMDSVSENFSSIQLSLSGNDDRNDRVMRDLSIAVKNNHGLALLMEGKVTEAIRQFQEGAIAARNQGQQTILIENEETTSLDHFSILSPHFNLTLLLWRDGHKDEATSLWLHARGMGQLTRKDLSSSEHRKLKSALEKAFNRHVLLIAEKNKHGRGGISDDYSEHVAQWQPESEGKSDDGRIGGLDAAQVLALDVLLLRHAAATASKRGAMSHLRSSGGLALSSFAAF
uniref:Uncharacterized protein n=1 Tax=Ditylum brightwellii TaxID=49249 RepID=A0A7S4VG92_9STRA